MKREGRGSSKEEGGMKDKTKIFPTFEINISSKTPFPLFLRLGTGSLSHSL
jgi:hypothetical protein